MFKIGENAILGAVNEKISCASIQRGAQIAEKPGIIW
jgi:hypothetical protein